MNHCRVCSNPIELVYRSTEAFSVTSMNGICTGSTDVWWCGACGHLQTAEITDSAAYYDTEYNIFVDSEEEDSLYKVSDGKKVYRVEHQISVLLNKIELPSAARVLDFGCAKSATTRQLLQIRPDLQIYLFDVSEAYVDFWSKFLPLDHCATYSPPPEWQDTFDVVLSFFALEHAPEPRRFITAIRDLLKPDGKLHLLVPNVYVNTADFVVIDHINHFSMESLTRLLAQEGFTGITVDRDSHDAAFVVTAQKTLARCIPPIDPRALDQLKTEVDKMSAFWVESSNRIRSFERKTGSTRAAIYGAGFYGTFIASRLADTANIECFIDQNEYRQQQRLLDRAIISPLDLDPLISTVYVGLNPRTAREIIEGIPSLCNSTRHFFYLDKC